MGDGCVDKRGEYLGAFGAAVVVGAPDGVGSEGEGGEESVGESAGAAEVGVRWQVDASVAGDAVQEVAYCVFAAVVDHDDPLHWVCLRGYHLEGGAEELDALVGHNDCGDVI